MLRRTKVDFSKVLRTWDGFGINCVEACQTLDYGAGPRRGGSGAALVVGGTNDGRIATRHCAYREYP